MACYRDGTVVPPGEEATAVAPLPVEALRLDPVATHAFRHAGLVTVGQVAGRCRAELTARFGAGMVFMLEAVLGFRNEPLSPRGPLPDYSVEHRFAEPIITENAILADVACPRRKRCRTYLRERGNGGTPHGSRISSAPTARCGALRSKPEAPTRDPAIIERLFREKLDALADPLDPGFGFDLIRLDASGRNALTRKPQVSTAASMKTRKIAFPDRSPRGAIRKPSRPVVPAE